MIEYGLGAVIGYLFGCIQTSYLAGKFIFKKDIRNFGSHNAGASNATMVFGLKYGILTGAVDIFKGVLPLLIIRIIFRDKLSQEELTSVLYVAALFVILGHDFPFYMGFRGGKGTSSLIGAMFAIHIYLGILGVIGIVAVVAISDYIVVGTLALLAVFAVFTGIYSPSMPAIISTAVIIFLSIYKHRHNLMELKNGTETKVRSVLFKK